MTDYVEERRSELEVLESIFPDELEVLSEDQLTIRVEPDVQNDNEPYVLRLHVTYTPTYPDEPPELSVTFEEGEADEEEVEGLEGGLRDVAGESVGMAMVFTLASSLKELLAEMLVKRKERIAREDEERYRKEEEAIAAKSRGTPVTKESFALWSAKFEAELAAQQKQEEEERIRALPPKEREEARRWAGKLTGRQQFEQDAALSTSDLAGLVDEGDVAIDISEYERHKEGEGEEGGVEEGVGRLRLGELSDDD
ncbi:hypothetical protein JCM6882_008720 [Rhodosporidiobolus microsporus]